MLKSVLTGKQCAECRNCCVFYNKSRWEMPAVTDIQADEIKDFLQNENAVCQSDGIYKMKSMLRENRPFENAEEYRCSALDENKGCRLPLKLKPIECSMWPVRVMNDKEKIYITLASGCHAANDEFTEKIKKLVDEELFEKICEILKTNKNIIKEYDKSYIKLREIKDFQ